MWSITVLNKSCKRVDNRSKFFSFRSLPNFFMGTKLLPIITIKALVVLLLTYHTKSLRKKSMFRAEQFDPFEFVSNLKRWQDLDTIL